MPRVSDERRAALRSFFEESQRGQNRGVTFVEVSDILGVLDDLVDADRQRSELRTMLREGKGIHIGPTTGSCGACGSEWTWRLGKPERHAPGCVLAPTEAEIRALEGGSDSATTAEAALEEPSVCGACHGPYHGPVLLPEDCKRAMDARYACQHCGTVTKAGRRLCEGCGRPWEDR